VQSHTDRPVQQVQGGRSNTRRAHQKCALKSDPDLLFLRHPPSIKLVRDTGPCEPPPEGPHKCAPESSREKRAVMENRGGKSCRRYPSWWTDCSHLLPHSSCRIICFVWRGGRGGATMKEKYTASGDSRHISKCNIPRMPLQRRRQTPY